MLSPQQAKELKRLDEKLAEVKARLAKPNPELDAAQAKWEADLKASKKKPKLPKALSDAHSRSSRPGGRAKQKQAIMVHYPRLSRRCWAAIRKELTEVQGSRRIRSSKSHRR